MKTVFPAEKVRNAAPSLICLLAIAVVAAGLVVTYFNWDFDDPFIVYRYARNILAGNGWCYNPGEHYNASTSALNTMIIAVAALVNDDPRGAAHLLGGLWLCLAGICVFWIFTPRFNRYVATLAAFFVVVSLGTNSTWGMETNLFIGLCLFFALLERNRNNSWYVLGFIVLARPDGALLLTLKLLWTTLKEKKLPWRGLLQSTLVLLPWVAFSLFSFHQLLPATLGQKVWQGQSGFWGAGNVYLPSLVAVVKGLSWWLVFPVLWGLATMAKEKSSLLYLVFFAIIQQAVYVFLNVPGYHWYPAVFVAVWKITAAYGLCAAGAGLFAIFNRGGRWENFPLSVATALALGVLVLAVGISVHLTSAPPVMDPRVRAYRTLAEYVDQTEPAGTLAALEVGVVGYYSRRKILDIIGLTTKAGEFATGRNNDRFFAIRPRIVVIHAMPSEKEAAIYKDGRFGLLYQLQGIIRSQNYAPVCYFGLKTHSDYGVFYQLQGITAE